MAFSPPPFLNTDRGGEGLSRSFRDMLPRSLGNDILETQARERLGRQPLDRQWTLFGQLLEDNGALRPRRASVATGAANRTRDSSRLRHRRPLPLNGDVGSPTGEPLPNRNRSSSRGDLPSRDLSSSRTGLLFDDPSSGAEPFSSDNEADSLLSGSTSTTVRSKRSASRPGRSSHPHEASYESSSDSEDESDEHPSDSRPATRHTAFSWLPSLTLSQKKVLKCSIAYTLGCLFTFAPALSNLLTDIVPLGSQQGPSPTGHMVATVAVYYNPAKTIGGMIEADLFCLVGATFASFASLMATDSFWFFELQPGWEWLADVLVLTLLAVAMTLIAWSKIWVGKPTFGSACSMTSIILFVVVVKEGGTEVLTQVLFITALGITISNLVCFTLWPQSATTDLQQEMTKTLDSFSTLLEMLTSTFLLEEQRPIRRLPLLRALEAHQKSFTSLKKVLAEARVEWGDPRIQRTAEVYDDAISGLNRLAQHFGGLRSGTKIQFDLIQNRRKTKGKSNPEGVEGSGNGKAAHASGVEPLGDGREDEEILLNTREGMFGSLIEDVGAPMKALSEACVVTLGQMSTAFNSVRQSDYDSDLCNFSELKSKINRALFTFESTSEHAVMRAFRRGDGIGDGAAASNETLDRENETVLLVFFFVFTLKEFARDLMALVDVMSVIYATERKVALENSSWGWLKRGIMCCIPRTRFAWISGSTQMQAQPQNRSRPSLRRRLSTLVPADPKNRAPLFPKVTPHAPNTALRLSRTQLSTWGRIKQSIWALGESLRQREIKYSIKTGMAVAMLAAPAFIESTRETFMEYRGEWALISCFVVLSPTVGATNFLSLHRIMGTLIGATVAVIVFTLFKHQPVMLTLCSFLYSIPCFYYIVNYPQYATSGRFVLLTYNLTCLFSYNSRDDNIPVLTVALHRATAVTIGVIWAFIVSRYWWPIEARRELGRVLSEFCVNICWFYQCLVSSYSVHPSILNKIASGKTENLTHHGGADTGAEMNSPTHLAAPINEFMAMELHLQLKLIELQELLAQTQNEPRLKGPFPVALYRTILTSLQSTLDMLHSLRCATTQEDWYMEVRKQFIIPVNKERREMVGNIILYFSTLSAAFQLKTPLPPYLPPAEQARRKLVDAVRQLDIVKNKEIKASKHLLYFAYVLLMSGVIKELEFLGRTLQEAFGVIGESAGLFEALFTNYDMHDEESGQPELEDR